MRLGADGLLAEDGLHRIAMATAASPTAVVPAAAAVTYPLVPPGGETVTALAGQPTAAAASQPAIETPISAQAGDAKETDDLPAGEPVLTADELRALLQEQPSAPPIGGASDG
jgi:hypothetical protein